MGKRRPSGDGDVCERCLWQMQRAKRSGSRADGGHENLECTGSAMRQQGGQYR